MDGRPNFGLGHLPSTLEIKFSEDNMISEESYHRYDVIIYYPIRIGDIFLVRMRKGREIKRKLTHSCLKRDYNDSLVYLYVHACTCYTYI